MSDFTVNIDSTLDLSKAESQMNSFLSKYKNEPIKINVELDTKGINTGNIGKQLQSSIGKVGISTGQAFNKNMESTISRLNIDQLVKRLNSKNISKDIVSGAEKSLNNLAKTGVQINKITEQYSGKNGLISLRIEGVDEIGEAVTILDKLNVKKKEWETTTIYTNIFKDVSTEANTVSKKLLSLEEIQARLFQAQGKTGALEAKFGNVDKFSQDFNELGTAINNAFKEVENGGDIGKLSTTLADIEAKIKTLTASTTEWHRVNKTDIEIQSSAKKQLEESEKYLNKQKELQSALDAFKKQNSSLLDPNSKSYSSSIVSEVKEVENAINSISSKSSATVASNMFSGLRASVKNASAEIKTEVTNITQDIDKIKDKFSNSQSNFNSIQYAFNKSSTSTLGTNGYNQIQQYLNQATEAANRFNAEIAKGESANLDSLNADLKEFTSLTSKASSEYSKLIAPASAIKQQNTLNDFLKWGNQNSKVFKAAGTQYNSIVSSLKGNLTTGQLDDVISKIKNFKTEMELSGNVGKNLFEEIGRGFKQIGQFATTYGIIQKIPQTISKAVSELKEVDSILTEISKTSDLTDSQIKLLGETAFESASVYGKTASDYLTGIQEMSRSGFYGEQAEELAKLSILGQTAGDMTADTSNSYLLATNAAYQYQGSVEKLNAVLDGQNMITNRNSVSMNDMAEATSEAASMAAQTGVAVDELSAMIGTMEARTKSGGSEVGNSIKALLVNLQNVNSDKITGTLDKANASMTEYVDGAEKLRTPIEILEDLAKTYNSLDESDPLKSEITTNIGGKIYHVA